MRTLNIHARFSARIVVPSSEMHIRREIKRKENVKGIIEYYSLVHQYL
jgi:hypothetical protein